MKSATGQTVVLCGDSVLMSSIGATCRRAGLEVVSIDTNQADPAEPLRRLSPSVILYDLAHPPAEFVLKSLAQDSGRLLIGVDLDNDSMLVLSGQQERAITTGDLVRVIETWRPSASGLTLLEGHLDRLWQFISCGIKGVFARPRRQKLLFAFGIIALGAILMLILSLADPGGRVPLAGAAIGTFSPHVALAFAGGMLLGALLLWLAIGRRRHQFQSNINVRKR